MEILIVKLTSMGDLIQLLPALTDLYHHYPEAKVDWVIDRSFQEIANWHPIVKAKIVSAHRVWRKQIWKTLTSGEARNFVKSLRSKQYDYVIDAHGMIKTALITRLAKGKRYGLDRESVTEKPSILFYNQHIKVDRSLHVITRLRLLLAQIFQYELPQGLPNYGISEYHFKAVNFALPKPYVLFVPNASWTSKLWPESHWQALIKSATEAGLTVLLPWGNEAERERAERLAKNTQKAVVLPRCSLSEIAYILQHAVGAICAETGFAHLAAALNVPAITYYGPNDPAWIGTIGKHQIHVESSFPCRSCYKVTCHYNNQVQAQAACMQAITPEQVWNKFKTAVLKEPQVAEHLILA